MSDIGRGDVVEATMDMSVTAAFGGPYVVAKGTRAIVLGIAPYRVSMCPTCGKRNGPGIQLVEYPLRAGIAWCVCEWRKVGGSREDHVGWFAEYLKGQPVIDAKIMRKLLAPSRRR